MSVLDQPSLVVAQMPAQPPVPAGQPTQAPPIDPAALLDMLRDIQLPTAVSWWPPAPGWWLLSVAVLLVYLGRRYEWYRRLRRRFQSSRAPLAVAADVAVLAEFRRIRASFAEDNDVQALSAALSVLLRRVAMRSVPRHEVAALTSESWLEWLDDHGRSRAFSSGVGRALLKAPYRGPSGAPSEIDGEALLRVCEEWVAEVLHRKVDED